MCVRQRTSKPHLGHLEGCELHSIPGSEGGGNFPAGDLKGKPKDVMQTGLRVLVVYEMESMEVQFETYPGLHVSSLLSQRSLLALSASIPG